VPDYSVVGPYVFWQSHCGDTAEWTSLTKFEAYEDGAK